MQIRKHEFAVPSLFLPSLGENSHLQFGHSLLEIVASKSKLSRLSNRGTRVARKRDVTTLEGESRKELKRSRARVKRTAPPALSHIDGLIGVDSLLIHHETKRNYFTRAQLSRDDLARTLSR